MCDLLELRDTQLQSAAASLSSASMVLEPGWLGAGLTFTSITGIAESVLGFLSTLEYSAQCLIGDAEGAARLVSGVALESARQDAQLASSVSGSVCCGFAGGVRG